MAEPTDIVIEPEDVTADWLSSVLGARVDAVTGHERIGTGQMSRNFRFTLDGGGPPTIVLKVPAADGTLRDLAASAYRREVGFYAEVADRLDCRLPGCHHHAISESGSEFVLVLDDLAPAVQGDQLAGCSVADARLALENLAGLHAPVWNDASLEDVEPIASSDPSLLGQFYPMAHDQFVERYAERLAPGTVEMLEPLRDTVVSWIEAKPGPFSLVHADYRLDNLLFTDGSVAAVDWQTVGIGPPARDVAYFLGNSLLVDDRRAHEDELLQHYLDALAVRGVTGYDLDALREDYARGGWLGPLTTVLGAFAATRTDRGDDMFVVMADRAAAQLRDHDSTRFLP